MTVNHSEKAVVRIYHPDGRVVGSGFLVEGGLIVTCVHVIKNPNNNLKSHPFLLDFPLSKSNKQKIEIEVLQSIEEKDIACLRLIGPAPEDVIPAKLISIEKVNTKSCFVFGFPEGRNDGVWAKGDIFEKTNENRWCQIQATERGGYLIQPGFSGAPVWDPDYQGVLGIITAAEKDETIRIAYMSPVSEFADLLSLKISENTMNLSQPKNNRTRILLGFGSIVFIFLLVACIVSAQPFLKPENTPTQQITSVRVVEETPTFPEPATEKVQEPISSISEPSPTETQIVVQPIIIDAPKLQPDYGKGICETGWSSYTDDFGHTAYLTLNINEQTKSTNSATWQPDILVSGYYQVEALIPTHVPQDWHCPELRINWDTSQAYYTIYHANGSDHFIGDQATLFNEWLDLGTFYFEVGDQGYVILVDLNEEKEWTTTISFSAMRFTWIGTTTP